jgi:hypothetical protein
MVPWQRNCLGEGFAEAKYCEWELAVDEGVIKSGDKTGDPETHGKDRDKLPINQIPSSGGIVSESGHPLLAMPEPRGREALVPTLAGLLLNFPHKNL